MMEFFLKTVHQWGKVKQPSDNGKSLGGIPGTPLRKFNHLPRFEEILNSILLNGICFSEVQERKILRIEVSFV